MTTDEVQQPADSAPLADSDPLQEWDLLTEIVLALVSQPGKVFVEGQEEENTSHFLIHVAPEDLGKVIGRNGETVSTIRKLIGRVSAARGRKTFIHIAEPGKPFRKPPLRQDRRNVAA